MSLSADGSTLLLGDPGDGDSVGATGQAWIYSRTAGVWSEAAELTGFGADSAGASGQGTSVALSADGNTAIIDGPEDAGNGAPWVAMAHGLSWQQTSTLQWRGRMVRVVAGYVCGW